MKSYMFLTIIMFQDKKITFLMKSGTVDDGQL